MDEEERSLAVEEIREEYGAGYLRGFTVTFYGLGDTVAPQAPLEAKQKEVIRETYSKVISSLGGRPVLVSKTRTGDAVQTDFTVSTTDTSCGDVSLQFDDESIKFKPDDVKFVDPAKANDALQQVVDIYKQNPNRVTGIKVDGFIAKTGSSNDPKIFSGRRAEAVRDELIRKGVPANVLESEGKGHGPHKNQAKNRMVKITISRDDTGC